MDDEYDPDALDEGSQEDEDRSRDAYKERIIALVDADQSMLGMLEQDGESMSYLSWVMTTMSAVMMDRVKSSPKDEICIVFYSTKERSESTEEFRTFDHVYEYMRLDTPDPATIRRVREFQDSEFQASPGCDDVSASPGRAAEDLKHGLWACWDILNRGSGGSRVDKTILLFTNNQDPLSAAGDSAAHLREQLYSRARGLGSMAVNIELIPLVQMQEGQAAFDHTIFWRQLITECSTAARGLADGLSADADDVAAMMDERMATQGWQLALQRARGLVGRLNRKRPLAALNWAITPDLKIAIKLYGLVQPAKKPTHKYVTRGTSDLVTSTNALVSKDTGTILADTTHKAFYPGEKLADRFPRVVMTKLEEKELKALRPKGLTLLGFKPSSCLKDHHQLAPSRFVYPDEWHGKGSTAAFAALHKACLRRKSDPQMAVCSYVRTAGSTPQLVALIPQAPVVVLDPGFDEGPGQETLVSPPGFHMIPLPFKDDLRSPEAEASQLKKVAADGPPPRASEEQIAAAEKLISALNLDFEDEPFTTETIPNPHLERYYQVLEDVALSCEPRELSELDDQTKPRNEDIDAHHATLDEFKLAMWGCLDGPPAPEKKAAAGAKRKAADGEAQVALSEEYSQHDWKALAADNSPKGGLAKLTAPTLKVYLKYHGLKLTGNKPDLIARVREHAAGAT